MKIYAALVLLLILTFTGACKLEVYNQGKQLYSTHCSNCHSDKGEGLEALIPDIQNSIYYSEKKSEFACIIRHGIVMGSRSELMDMPANKKLTANEISNIINYVSNKWAEDFEERTIIEVENDLKLCASPN